MPPRGFASYLFILGIATILSLNAAFPHAQGNSPLLEMRRAATHRLLLENAVDEIIVEKLREGLVAHAEPELIRGRINETIIYFLQKY